MEDAELQWAMQTAEAIRGLQAGQIAQGRMLRALIASHPDPEALRAAWRSFSSPSLADAAMSQISDPNRMDAHQALLQALKDWDRRLEQDLRAP